LFQQQTGAHPKPVNGVSKPPLIPLVHERVLPTSLHIPMGLLNDEVKHISAELLELDKVDPALVLQRQQAAEILEDIELTLVGNIEGAAELLGLDHPVVVELVVDDVGKLLEDLGSWARLITAIETEAEAKAAAAAAERNPPALPLGQVRSKRVLGAAELRAKSLDGKAECLTKVATVLSDNFKAVDAARQKVVELEQTIFGTIGEFERRRVVC
jgi:hypothetical protein